MRTWKAHSDIFSIWSQPLRTLTRTWNQRLSPFHASLSVRPSLPLRLERQAAARWRDISPHVATRCNQSVTLSWSMKLISVFIFDLKPERKLNLIYIAAGVSWTPGRTPGRGYHILLTGNLALSVPLAKFSMQDTENIRLSILDFDFFVVAVGFFIFSLLFAIFLVVAVRAIVSIVFRSTCTVLVVLLWLFLLLLSLFFVCFIFLSPITVLLYSIVVAVV